MQQRINQLWFEKVFSNYKYDKEHKPRESENLQKMYKIYS